MEAHKEDADVPNEKLDVDVAHEGRKAQNRVEDNHENELIEVLWSCPGFVNEDFATNNVDLHDDLGSHHAYLPNQIVVVSADRQGQEIPPCQEEDWLDQHLSSTFKIEVAVEFSESFSYRLFVQLFSVDQYIDEKD